MRKIILLNMIVLAFIFSSNTSFGEENHASKDWQIKAYSTAAPSFIGKYATIKLRPRKPHVSQYLG